MTEEEKDYEILSEDVAQVNFSFKIIVIGDSAVGKSCLALRGTKNHFRDFYFPTIGFEFLSFNIRIKDKIVKLQIWDTCGQEAYRSLISSFYKNSSLAIIVYSIDNEQSFYNLETWLDEIKTQTHPDLKIFLIGNKADLEDKRVVQKSTAEELVKERNINLFLETSAKSGQNAQLVFVKAAKILVENYKDYTDLGRNSNISDNPSISISNDNNDIKNDQKDDDKNRRKKCCKQHN